MLFLRGASRPLGLGWLYFHLLLSSHWVPTVGELCRSWTCGVRLAARPFRCPQPQDSPDAKFCCGSCNRPVCCASIEARLHPAQCRVDPQPKGLPAAPLEKSAETEELPTWAIILVIILAIILSIPFGYALKLLLCYSLRRIRQCLEPDEGLSSVSDMFYVSYEGPPPYDSVFPDGPPSPLPTNNLPAAQQGQVNDGFEEGESPPGPNSLTDLDLSGEDLSQGTPGMDSPPSDADEAFGPRCQGDATLGDVPSRDNAASGLDAPSTYASLPPLPSTRTLATFRGPSRTSSVASNLVPEEPPTSRDAAASVGPEALPPALDHLPAVPLLAQPRMRWSLWHREFLWILLLWVQDLWFQLRWKCQLLWSHLQARWLFKAPAPVDADLPTLEPGLKED